MKQKNIFRRIEKINNKIVSCRSYALFNNACLEIKLIQSTHSLFKDTSKIKVKYKCTSEIWRTGIVYVILINKNNDLKCVLIIIIIILK